jgi:GLTT repeat (6 copies)
MNSPKDPVRSNPELDYAPPWARESARDQMRPTLGEPVALPADKQAENKLVSWANRNSADDRAWQQRALDPELVPEPPADVSNVWPTMLRLGIVCAIAAFVAAAVVLLFNPKQSVHHTAQTNVTPSSLTADDRTLPLVDSVRIVPGLVAPGLATQGLAAQGLAAQGLAAPGLADAGSPIASTPPPQPPPAQATVPAPPPQAIASLPPPNQSSANVETPPASAVNQPVVNQPAVSPVEANSAANETPSKVQTAAVPPTQPASSSIAKQSAARPPVALDDSEIAMLIKRGNNLLKDGDFAAARLLFERGANAGSAEAALALGSTYDPLVIKRLGAIMVRPDVENARKWYQIAADRGSADAKLQLANLPQSH